LSYLSLFCSYHGIATHYLDSSSLGDLEARLAELTFPDSWDINERYESINNAIDEYATGLPSTRPSISGSLRKTIDATFSHSSVSDILADLEKVKQSSDEQLSTWAKRTADTIAIRSPTSVEVALRQMHIGSHWNIAETFQQEHNIASRFMSHNDFVEGVTAKLVRKSKDRPNWSPNTLQDIKPKDIDTFFSDPPMLPLLNSGRRAEYEDYPYPKSIGLPSEATIQEIISMNKWTEKTQENADEIVTHFLEKSNGKQGTREKVVEFLERLGYYQ
jgi:3-hydroxyisobutyryl-CoA hydrolase